MKIEISSVGDGVCSQTATKMCEPAFQIIRSKFTSEREVKYWKHPAFGGEGPLYKTQKCKQIQQCEVAKRLAWCNYGKMCMFAHSSAEADVGRLRHHDLTGKWLDRVEFAHEAKFLTWAKTTGQYYVLFN